MMDKAMLRGLAFRRAVDLDQASVFPPISDSYAEFLHGAYKAATLGKPYYRPMGAEPAPSSATEIRVSINETIDASVFERWRADNAYRPFNLQEWAARRKVDPAVLSSAVRADDPMVTV